MKNMLFPGKIVLFISLLGAFLAHKAVFSGAFDPHQERVPQKVKVIQNCLNSYPNADKEKQSIDLDIDIAGLHVSLTGASYLVYPVNINVAVAIPQAIKDDFRRWLQYKNDPGALMALLHNWEFYPHVGNDESNIIGVLYNTQNSRIIYFEGLT